MSHGCSNSANTNISISESSGGGGGGIVGGGGVGVGLGSAVAAAALAQHHPFAHQQQQQQQQSRYLGSSSYSGNKVVVNNNNSGGGLTSGCSSLVAASDSLVLENEQILKLFPKCRPRRENESMNQFYASIKDQHQPAATSSATQANEAASKPSTAYNSSTSSTMNKKLITDSNMMMSSTASSQHQQHHHQNIGGGGASASASSAGGGGGNNPMLFNNTHNNNTNSSTTMTGANSMDYMMYSVTNKKERTITNPFLTNSTDSQRALTGYGAGAEEEEEEQMTVELLEDSSAANRGANKLTHSQSDCGVCFAGQGGATSAVVAASAMSSFPTSASSTQLSSANCNAETMSKNFQRHMKNPLNSNPFIGGTHKLEDYEEELKIITVQDQQQQHQSSKQQHQQHSPAEYFFDRRPIRQPPPSHHKGYTNSSAAAVSSHPYHYHQLLSNHNNSQMRSTPVSNLLHSPELKDNNNREVVYCNNNSTRSGGGFLSRDYHYLNVGRSPVNSISSDHQLNEDDEEEEEEEVVMDRRTPQKSHHQQYLEKKSPSPALSLNNKSATSQNKVIQDDNLSSAAVTAATKHSSTGQFSTAKKRNKSVAVVSEGEVVIFDDIEESWYKNLKAKPESIGEGHVYRQNFIADPDSVSPDRNSLDGELSQQQPLSKDNNCSSAVGATATAANVPLTSTTRSGSSASSSSVAGMVIEYSESPRRFGAGRGQSTTTAASMSTTAAAATAGSQYSSPRPGFPHRIVTPSSPPLPPSSQQLPPSSGQSSLLTVIPYGAGGGGGDQHGNEMNSAVAVESPVQAFAAASAAADPDASRSCKMNSIAEDYEDVVDIDRLAVGDEDRRRRRRNCVEVEEVEQEVDGEEEDDEEQLDNNIEDDSQTGINVLDNVYKDTGLSVRDNDDDGVGVNDGYTMTSSMVPTSTTFDYLYEFSETRKVLEEFFKCPTFELDDEKFADKLSESECDSVDIRYEFRESSAGGAGGGSMRMSPTMCRRRSIENLDSGSPTDAGRGVENEREDDDEQEEHHHHHRQAAAAVVVEEEEDDGDDEDEVANEADVEDEATRDESCVPSNHRRRTFDLSISSLGRQSPEIVMLNNHHHLHNHHHHHHHQQQHNQHMSVSGGGSGAGQVTENGEDKNNGQNQYFRYSPETTDYDSNCGDLDSLSGDFNAPQSVINYQAYMRQCYASMPVLEDGLSSGHASDAENNNTTALAMPPPPRNGLRMTGNNGHSHEEAAAVGKEPEGRAAGGGMGKGAAIGALSPSIENMIPITSPTTATTSFPHSMAGTATGMMSVRNSGCGTVDGGNVTPNHRHFMQQQQQLATDNYYLNATSKQQQSHGHGCLGNGLDSGLSPPPPPGGVQLNEPLTAGNPDIHPSLLLDRNNKSPFIGGGATSPLIRDENLNPIDSNSATGMTASTTTTTAGGIATGGNNVVAGCGGLNNKRIAPGAIGGGTTGAGGLNINSKIFKNTDPDLESLYSINKFQSNVPISEVIQMTPPPPPAPVPYRKPAVKNTPGLNCDTSSNVTLHNLTSAPINVPTSTGPTAPTTEIQAALKDIRSTIQRTKNLQQDLLSSKLDQSDYHSQDDARILKSSAVWMPSFSQCREDSAESTESDVLQELKNASEEEEPDTDLETDRLLGHQRSDDTGFYDSEKNWLNTNKRNSLLSKLSPKIPQSALSLNGLTSSANTKSPLVNNNLIRHGLNTLIPSPVPEHPTSPKTQSSNLMDISESISSPEHSDKDVNPSSPAEKGQLKRNDESPGGASLASNTDNEKKKKNSKSKEVLIEGVLFRAKYLGSTQLVCEGQPTKSTRMMQAEEAVSRIKALAPEGEGQPSTEVDLFISTEKIMVLNTDLKEIMMDHALRTISYIADIGDLVVLMARRRFVPQDVDDAPKPNRTPKMICHVFESEEAQFIAQSIGQAFQVAYMEFLKANGIEDHSFVKEMDYQEVLNSQEIFGDELEIFAKKELQKEVVVPKAKGEILGVVIVESGWGSMLPTVVIANLLSNGAAARCGQLNIGDQIIAINGLSLVGLPLSTCQTYIKNTKNQTVVKFTVVPCPPVVEVKIKRPNTKYQLGFSVQNGVICSLLRGGIAERGGVRVGHRIIEINNQSVVAVPHEKIVNLLATSVGEILMKTMPTSMFRLLTGQENPIYI